MACILRETTACFWHWPYIEYSIALSSQAKLHTDEHLKRLIIWNFMEKSLRTGERATEIRYKRQNSSLLAQTERGWILWRMKIEIRTSQTRCWQLRRRERDLMTANGAEKSDWMWREGESCGEGGGSQLCCSFKKKKKKQTCNQKEVDNGVRIFSFCVSRTNTD